MRRAGLRMTCCAGRVGAAAVLACNCGGSHFRVDGVIERSRVKREGNGGVLWGLHTPSNSAVVLT